MTTQRRLELEFATIPVALMFMALGVYMIGFGSGVETAAPQSFVVVAKRPAPRPTPRQGDGLQPNVTAAVIVGGGAAAAAPEAEK